MDFDSAIASHIRWKLHLYRCLQGQAPVPPADEVALVDGCALGQLLRDCEAAYQRLGSYRLAKGAHAIFHARAAEVVRTIASNQLQRAKAMLAAGAPYDAASHAVVLALAKLQADTRRLESTALRMTQEAARARTEAAPSA
jgi:hypothetical protein